MGAFQGVPVARDPQVDTAGMKKPAEAGEGPWSPEESLYCVPIPAGNARNFITSCIKTWLNGTKMKTCVGVTLMYVIDTTA
jgi:hypothetical protein